MSKIITKYNLAANILGRKEPKKRVTAESTPKIPDSLVLEIIREYLNGGVTREELSIKYGITVSAIRGWVTGNNRSKLLRQVEKEKNAG